MFRNHYKQINRLTIDSFEKRETCPWCRSRHYSEVAHLQFNTAYHSPITRFLMDDLVLKNRKIVRCLDCGLNYNVLIPATETLTRMSERGETKQMRNTKDPIWTFSNNRNAYKHADLLKALITNPSASVLDIGCYRGQFLSLLPESWRRCGLEPDTGKARSTGRMFDVKQDYIESNSLPWPSGSFDAITMFDVLEHCRDLQNALSNIHNLLKPNGWLMIETGNAACSEAKMTGSLWWYFNLFEHFVFLDPASIKRIFSDSGFDIYCLDEIYHVTPKSLGKTRPIKNYGITALAWIATLGGAYAIFYKCLANILNRSGRLPKLYGRNHLFILAQKKCG